MPEPLGNGHGPSYHVRSTGPWLSHRGEPLLRSKRCLDRCSVRPSSGSRTPTSSRGGARSSPTCGWTASSTCASCVRPWPTPGSPRSTRPLPRRCRASSPCSPATTSTFPPTTACSCSTRRSPPPAGPATCRTSWATRSRSSWARRRPPPRTAPRRSSSTTSRWPAVVGMEAALDPDAPLHSRLGRQHGRRPALARQRRPPGRRRRGRAGPRREPARSRSCRWRATRSPSCPATTATATSSPSTSRRRCPTAARQRGRASSRSRSRRCASSPPTSAAASAARPGCRPSTPSPSVWPAGSTDRSSGSRPARRTSSAMPHGRGQIQYVEMGFTARRDLHRAAGPLRRRRRRLRRVRRGARARSDHGLMAQGVYRIPKVAFDGGGRRDQHHADGRVPGRRPARGGRDAGADHGHRRRRARDRPGRAAAAQLPPRRRVPVHDAHRAARTTAATTTAALARGGARGRLRGAARRAGGPPGAGRPGAARHRRRGVRRDHRRRRRAASTDRSRCTRTARPRSRSAPRRTARATPPRSR